MKDRFWKIKNQVNGSGEILLYGPIASSHSWFNDTVTPQEFVRDLESLNGKDVTVRINSGGGDVFAAHAIHNQLVAYKGRVTVIIDGLAASAATIVAMAGQKIIMPSNSMMMIHNPAIGMDDYYTAEDLQKYVDALTAIKGSIVAAYKKRCKLSSEELEILMDAETWMGAQECLDKGFADEINGSIETVLNGNTLIINSAKYDLTAYKNAASIKNCINEKEKNMSRLEEILDSLGLKIVDSPKAKNTTVQVATPVSPQPTDNSAAIEAAVAAERQRIVNLEALDSGDNAAVKAIINQAKADGKTVAEVQPYIDAVKTVPAAQNAAQRAVADMIADNKDSGADGIASGANDDAALEKAADAKAMDNMVEIMNKKFGGVK
nr:MAG TPA: Putative ATP dependent Clp protease [Caudoviricetes sp.]